MAKFLTIQELSKALGLSDTWIKKQVRAGQIPHVRDGHQLRFPAEQATDAAQVIAIDSASAASKDEEERNG